MLTDGQGLTMANWQFGEVVLFAERRQDKYIENVFHLQFFHPNHMFRIFAALLLNPYVSLSFVEKIPFAV